VSAKTNDDVTAAGTCCDLLLSGGLILTLDAADRSIADGAIAIRDGRIVAIGDRDEVERQWRAARTIDCHRGIVVPGLVNIHNHTPLMITRGMIEDLGFAPMFTPGIPQGHRLSEDDAYSLARLGTYELLRSGCTTIVDFYRHPQALARSHAELGSRAIIAGRIHDADPETLTRGRYEHDTAIGKATIAENLALIESWDGYDDGRIRCDLAPHAPDTCSRALLSELATLTAGRVGNVHTHLCQSPAEVARVRARDGCSPVQLLDDVGLLNARLVAAHCIHVEPDDIARMGAAAIVMAYAPIGNAKTGRIAPALTIARAGASITLCTDTFSGDMFEAMRWAVAMQRIHSADTDITARTALRWATSAGAVALGLGDEIGSLEVGKRADIVILDATAPTLAPVVDGYGILVYSANGANVDTVIVGGRVVVSGGVLKTADGGEIVRRAQAVAERLWRAAGRQPVTMAAANA
jgi:5-methylthioadenosine/S-adenosylhomocysteine deaminase